MLATPSIECDTPAGEQEGPSVPSSRSDDPISPSSCREGKGLLEGSCLLGSPAGSRELPADGGSKSRPSSRGRPSGGGRCGGTAEGRQPSGSGCKALQEADGDDLPPADLEARLEEDYSHHLATRNSHQMCKYGAMGVGIGGALGLAAAPFVMPAVAVGALLAGGASGLNFALRKDRKERSRIPGSDTARGSSSGRPSLRRLKFLVEWGYLKLTEFENERPEWGARVLDDVVTAFSPWIQQIYLLRARRGAEAEIAESVRYLVPLYYFLQRTVCSMALLKVVELTGAAFDDASAGSAWIAACLDRCRVGFPTVLETISVVDRLSPSVAPRAPGRQRLRRIVDAIQAVLAQPAVQQALATGHPSLRTSPSAASRPPEFSGHGLPEFPPEGAEDELSMKDEAEEDYFSVSEDSKSPRQSPSPRHVSVLRALRDAETETAVAYLHRRLARFRRGEGDFTWSSYDASEYNLRSPTYLQNRVKEPSRDALFELVNVDLCVCPSGPITRVAGLPGYYPAYLRQTGDTRFLVVFNLIITPYQIVFTGAVDHAAMRSSPAARDLWVRFLDMTPEERNTRLKMIAGFIEGPWLLKSIAPDTRKPLMVAKAMATETWHEADNYLEVDLHAGASKSWETVVKMAIKTVRRTKMHACWVLEGLCPEELPEAVLVAGTITRMDPDGAMEDCPY